MMPKANRLPCARFSQKQSLRQVSRNKCIIKEVLTETSKEARETGKSRKSQASMYFSPGQGLIPRSSTV